MEEYFRLTPTACMGYLSSVFVYSCVSSIMFLPASGMMFLR